MRPSNKTMELLKEIAALQTEYEKLKNSEKMTKKAICDLVIPFRDKYHLSDKDALAIAQNKVSIAQMVTLLEAGLNRIVRRKRRKWLMSERYNSRSWTSKNKIKSVNPVKVR